MQFDCGRSRGESLFGEIDSAIENGNEQRERTSNGENEEISRSSTIATEQQSMVGQQREQNGGTVAVCVNDECRTINDRQHSTVGRKRHFVFTWNNYPAEHRARLEALKPSFLLYQGEIGANGTKHLQGVICFRNARAFSAVARSIRGWHVETMRGRIDQAVAYCTKEETRDPSFGEPQRFGTCPRNAGTAGGRSDIDAVAAAITEDGQGVEDVAQNFGGEFIKYHRGIERLVGLRMQPRDFKTEIYWYYGSTGTGKSRAARNEAPGAYWKNPAHKWWDGYEGQSDVVIDDYRPDFCKFSELLRLFDEYPHQIECKGGTRQFISKRIFVTAPKRPDEIWESRTPEDLQQLMRRITEIKRFGDHAFNN